MNGFRDLIREIRRRSLLRVLAVFAASAWLVLQVLDVLISNGIVPGWVFRGAFVLLLIGLPVVMATAFVQAADAGAGNGPAGGDAASPADATSQGRPVLSAHQRLLTWRNALLAGVGAFALLGFAGTGYMGLRALGIGPFGSLMAQGVIERGAQVLLADFDGGDREIADVVRRALLIDLAQSPLVRVLDRTDLGGPIERMQLPEDTRITEAVATQLAEREGYAAFVTGDVAPLGSGWVLTASIHGGAGFDRLAGFRETARTDAELVDAVERLSRAIRDRLGESLRSTRTGPPLAQVTTASLPALRAYTRGVEAEAVGDLRTALAGFERAVAIDSTFAMAHRKVSAVLGNLGERPVDMRRAARRAWELSERLPPRERQLAAGYYHMRLSGDAEAAIRAFEDALLFDSTDAAVRNNLAVAYRYMGRYEDATRQYEAALREHNNWTLWYNLALDRNLAGDVAGAIATLDSATAALPEWRRAYRWLATIAASSGDLTAADAYVNTLDDIAATPLERSDVREMRYILAATRGRLRDAERALEAPGAELFIADPAYRAVARAHLLLLSGDTAGAVQHATDAHAAWAASPELNVTSLLGLLIEARAPDPAARIMADRDRSLPPDERGIIGRFATELLTARLTSLRGEHASAIDRLEALARRAAWMPSRTMYAIGRVQDAAGRPDLAIAAYEKALAVPDPTRYAEYLEVINAIRRLAELHDAAGNAPKAIEYYARLVELWKDADPELQPVVEAARRRIGQLLPDR